MPRSRRGNPRCRGASAPEYAIGAAVLAVLLIGGMQAVETAADERYDDQQAIVATPVTDVSGATVTTAGPTSTTATIPPAVTTTSTTTPSEPTTTTTAPAPPTTPTTLPSLTFTAVGRESGNGNNDWWIQYSVTASAPTSATVTITWPGGSRTNCSLPCSGNTSPLFDKHTSSATISTTTIAGYSGPAQTSVQVAEP